MPVPLIRAAAALAALPLATCSGGERAQESNGAAADAAGPAAPAVRTTRAPAPAQQPPAASPPAQAAEPRTAPWSATGYAFNGTEPFWGGSLTGTTVRYMTPEDQFGDVIETSVAFTPDRETYSGRHGGQPFVLALARAACSDGMSDRTYAFSATLQVDGETRRGCADPQ